MVSPELHKPVLTPTCPPGVLDQYVGWSVPHCSYRVCRHLSHAGVVTDNSPGVGPERRCCLETDCGGSLREGY